jgi:hypothetical protein
MLNDEILASANSAWNDCGKFDISVIQEDLLNRYTRRAVSMVAEEYEGASPIVLKDPRICRMLSFWLPALESDSNRLHEANPLISNHLHAPCTRLSYGETS